MICGHGPLNLKGVCEWDIIPEGKIEIYILTCEKALGEN